jgi:predicted nucleic acid-binding Zn ribbon protein
VETRMIVIWGRPPLTSDWYECENCGKRHGVIHMDVPNFCPHCGGRIRQ